jgi:hypothetical protein
MMQLGDGHRFEEMNINGVDKISYDPLSIDNISCDGYIFPVIGPVDPFGMGNEKTKPDDTGQKEEKEDEPRS